MGSNNFDGPILLDDGTSYIGWRRPSGDESTESRIYQGTADPSGVLTAPVGSLYIRSQAGSIGLYQNTDGATAWAVANSGTEAQALPLEKELLPIGNEVVEDAVRVNAPGTLKELYLYMNTAYTSAGTFLLDVELNGVSVLSAPQDVKAVAALPGGAALPLVSPQVLVAGDVLRIITSSANVDLQGEGLTLVLKTGV